MGAYQYGRSSVGFQALISNALLTHQWSLGNVTELLSGDFNAPFGRSSQHQIWSQAMVILPILRGMFGITVSGNTLTFAPQLPANWDQVEVDNVPFANARYNLSITRQHAGMQVLISLSRPGLAGPGSKEIATPKFIVAPAFPLDAKILNVSMNSETVRPLITKIGDVQKVAVQGVSRKSDLNVFFEIAGATDVFTEAERSPPGAQSNGLRIIRSQAGPESLRLVLEGLAGHSYTVSIVSQREPGTVAGAAIEKRGEGVWLLHVPFEGTPGSYVHRELHIPLLTRNAR